MNCRRVGDDDLAEMYLRGTLAGAVRVAFEKHFLHCGRCFEALATEWLLRFALATPRGTSGDEPVSAPTRTLKRRLSRRRS